MLRRPGRRRCTAGTCFARLAGCTGLWRGPAASWWARKFSRYATEGSAAAWMPCSIWRLLLPPCCGGWATESLRGGYEEWSDLTEWRLIRFDLKWINKLWNSLPSQSLMRRGRKQTFFQSLFTAFSASFYRFTSWALCSLYLRRPAFTLISWWLSKHLCATRLCLYPWAIPSYRPLRC